MKQYILDSNILIKNPSILTRWNSNYKILIPDLVLEETGKVIGRIRGAENLLHSIDNASIKGFTKIIKVDQDKYPYRDEIYKDLGLSNVDYQIAHLAKDYSKDKVETYLVTEDRGLLKYAQDIGVKTMNLFALQNDLLSYKTVNLDDLGGSKNISQFQFRHLVISFISGIALTAVSSFAYRNFEWIVSNFPIWGTIAGLIITPFVFYWVRIHKPIAYAVPEFIFGFYCAYTALNPLLMIFDFTKLYKWDVMAPILVGIYVMVRGLDNLDRGIKGTILERPWKILFNPGN